jgi:hypothetical protein
MLPVVAAYQLLQLFQPIHSEFVSLITALHYCLVLCRFRRVGQVPYACTLMRSSGSGITFGLVASAVSWHARSLRAWVHGRAARCVVC